MLAKLSRPLLLAALVSPAAAAEGLYWESSSTGGPAAKPDDAPRLAKSFAMPGKLKREDADSAIIARLDRGAIYILNLKEKTYEEIKLADLDASQKKAEKQSEGKREAAVEVTKTAETRSIAGHACTRYSGKQGGKETLVVWTTTEIKGFAALRADWLEAMKRVASMSPFIGRSRGQAFEKIDGFPLETVMGTVRTLVTRVEERDTPASEFEVPPGFTRKAAAPTPGAGQTPKEKSGGAAGK